MSPENECRTFGSKSKHCNKNENKEIVDSIITNEQKQRKKLKKFGGSLQILEQPQ